MSLPKRGLYFSAALTFLFFLAFSAPHRVHHFFEQAKQHVAEVKAHDHSEGTDHSGHDRPSPSSKPSDCAVLSVAQTAHASLVTPFSLPHLDRTADFRDHHFAPAIPSRYSSPAAPRAPPLT